jgi:hypothetical protein
MLNDLCTNLSKALVEVVVVQGISCVLLLVVVSVIGLIV